MKKIVGFLMTVAALNSCGLYTKYERPEVNTADLYGEKTVVSDTSSLAGLHWSELFIDPQLQQLVCCGLEQNTDLKIAALKVEEARASLQTARLAYLPAVSLDAEGTLSSFDKQKTAKSYQLAPSASWEIDLFGKLTNAKRGARAALEESEAYRQAVQTQLVATVADSYYTLLMLDEQLSVTEKTVATWKENVKAMRALKKAGQTTEAAVAQSEASSLEAEAKVVSLKRQISEAENSLATLLARPPRSIDRGTLAGQHFPEKLSAGIPLDLLANRPDVKQAESALAQAFYSTNEARSAFYPTITLSGSAGWTNSGGGVIANPGSWLLQAVGSLTQPLFNKGTNIARLKIAKAQQEEARLSFQQSLLTAGSEVNNALVQWTSARERILLGEKQLASLQKAVSSTRLLMRHGDTNYLEVLTAQQTLLQAQLTQVSDRFDEIQGVINLYHALGGGAAY